MTSLPGVFPPLNRGGVASNGRRFTKFLEPVKFVYFLLWFDVFYKTCENPHKPPRGHLERSARKKGEKGVALCKALSRRI
jgi:hypothetical protein